MPIARLPRQVFFMERIKCKRCGSIGYSASHDVICSECGNRSHVILDMSTASERRSERNISHYLERIAYGNAKPGAFCRDRRPDTILTDRGEV